ncbi:MAG: adenine deaminase [Anaerolineae bacterium]|nr:adenine deaminase [Anaerolineae bacterium]
MNILKTRFQVYDALLAAARGDAPADLALRGGRMLNVMTGEILSGDIGITHGFITSVMGKNIAAKESLDISGLIALPAFIDPHVHIESSMVLPPAYAEVAAANGTGTILADPHEIVNVMGVEGFSLMADNAADLPVRFFFDIPTCVPAKRQAESSGAEIGAAEVRQMAQRGGRKLGELMSYEEIIANDAVLAEVVKTGWELGLPRDAHFPMFDVLGGVFNQLNPLQKIVVFGGMLAAAGLRLPGLAALPYNILAQALRRASYPALNAYLTALGITADHETYGPELQVKLDHSMRLMLSSHVFSFAPMTPLLLQGVRRMRYKDAIGLCTDDIWPDQLLEKGGLVGVMRDLTAAGLEARDVVRFATLNNAQRLALAGMAEAAYLGSLAPGCVADIVLAAEPLRKFDIRLVLHEGKVVAENGKVLQPCPPPGIPAAALETVRLERLKLDDLRIAVPKAAGSTARARVLVLPKPPELPFPQLVEEDVPVVDGWLDTSGYVTIATLNRYGKGSGVPSLGLIRGYTLRDGAVASTLAHDSHNLVVLGSNPQDMLTAANQVIASGGGMAAVQHGEVLASIPFPVGGIMRPGSVAEAAPLAAAFRKAIGALGLDPSSPILPFAIFSLPAAPGAKVTDRGIWDGDHRRLVEVLVQ